jgi:hypothetical protein
VLWEEEPPMQEAEEYHLSSRKSLGGELHDLNRDEVVIPILVEITHGNDYNGVPSHKEAKLVRHHEVSNTIRCYQKRSIIHYNEINSAIYICLGQRTMSIS